MVYRRRLLPTTDVWARVYEARDRHDPHDALADSETDFDDETDDDQLPLDVVEAIELGVNLDDPEEMSRREADVD